MLVIESHTSTFTAEKNINWATECFAFSHKSFKSQGSDTATLYCHVHVFLLPVLDIYKLRVSYYGYYLHHMLLFFPSQTA